MKVDMHVHTKYSGHSFLDPVFIRKVCTRKGFSVAITDHNTIVGAQKLNRDWNVIIGEEIMTDQGEVIGLFLNEEISPGPLHVVMDSLREQDAIVVIPHPFDHLRKSRLKDLDVMASADVIEVFNSRTVTPEDNRLADEFATKNDQLKSAGSDAHTRFEIGNAYVEIEEFNSKGEFLEQLGSASIVGKKSSLWVHGITKTLKVFR